MTEKQDISVVTLRVRRKISDLIDIERSKFSMPKSSWITQAIVEKLERLGYEIDINEKSSEYQKEEL
jgi:hypothetical protein